MKDLSYYIYQALKKGGYGDPNQETTQEQDQERKEQDPCQEQ